MWKRNLVFLGVCLLGLASLLAGLLPNSPLMSERVVSELRAKHEGSHEMIAAVNAAFRRQWAAAGVKPAPRADDLAIVRRLSLGLTGVIPSLEELRWLETQPADDRIGSWLSHLLSDRRSADYLAERFARPLVGVDNDPFLIFRRRRLISWLSDQLLANRPYDQLVRELLTAEGLWTDQPAVNFVTAAVEQDQDGPNEAELTGRVARAMLGVRLDCAECHDHPFAEWKQNDFQGLAAYFGQTETSLAGVRENAERVYEIADTKTGSNQRFEPCVPYGAEWIDRSGTRRQQLASWVTHPSNEAFARVTVNRVWALLFGAPLVEPIDDIPLEGERPEALDLLARDFIEHGYDLRRLIVTIAASEAFQLDSATDDPAFDDSGASSAGGEELWSVFPLTRLRPEQVVGAIVQSASLETIDSQSHIFTRFLRFVQTNEFVERYGDPGASEFERRGETIPQQLLLLNGQLVRDKTGANPFNAATRLAVQARDDAHAVELAYLTVLTRQPTAEESQHFCRRLAEATGPNRAAALEDLTTTLINSTEFSWNH